MSLKTMLSSALEETFRPLKNLLTQLSGKNREKWIKVLRYISRMDVDSILRALRDSSEKVWKRFDLLATTREEMFRVLKGVNARISQTAIVMAGQPEFVFPTQTEKDVEFIMGSLRTLFASSDGMKHFSFLNNEFLAGYEYELCRESDAFYLIAACKDEDFQQGKTIAVGMKPIDIKDEGSKVFLLGNKNNEGLSSRLHDPENLTVPDDLWVFRRKKIQAKAS